MLMVTSRTIRCGYVIVTPATAAAAGANSISSIRYRADTSLLIYPSPPTTNSLQRAGNAIAAHRHPGAYSSDKK